MKCDMHSSINQFESKGAWGIAETRGLSICSGMNGVISSWHQEDAQSTLVVQHMLNMLRHEACHCITREEWSVQECTNQPLYK